MLALIELADSLYMHLDQHESIIGMHFDVQKAFDTVDRETLLFKLQNYTEFVALYIAGFETI